MASQSNLQLQAAQGSTNEGGNRPTPAQIARKRSLESTGGK
jgi:hypothetical protein